MRNFYRNSYKYKEHKIIKRGAEMNRADKEFTIGAITIFSAALSASISIRAGLNIVPVMCFGTAAGIILGILLTGIFKGKRHEYSIEGKSKVIKKKPKKTSKKR